MSYRRRNGALERAWAAYRDAFDIPAIDVQQRLYGLALAYLTTTSSGLPIDRLRVAARAARVGSVVLCDHQPLPAVAGRLGMSPRTVERAERTMRDALEWATASRELAS